MKPRNHRQEELDRLAAQRRWDAGPFKSYKAFGFTVSVAAKPEHFVAARGSQRFENRDLYALERTIAYVAAVGRMPKRKGKHPLQIKLPPS